MRPRVLTALLRSASLALVLVASCASTLDLNYAYRLEQASGESPLAFADDDFVFAFTAVETGVLFQVENQSDQAAYIDWNNCYFSEPDGNTFNALNTDILNESDEVASRTASVAAHRTQLPAGATVKRFTTATVNAEEDNMVTLEEVGTMLSTTNVWYQPSQGWGWSHVGKATTGASFARSFTMTEIDHWYARRYWPSTLKMRSGMKADSKDLAGLAENIRLNPGYTLGLRVLVGEEQRDYKFSFVIDAVFASKEVQLEEEFRSNEKNQPRTKRELKFYALNDEDWLWRDGQELE